MCAHLTNNTTASILKPKIVNSAQNIDTSPSTLLTFLIFQLPYIDHSTLLHRPLPPAILNPFHQQQIHRLALYQKPINSISDRPSMASETNQPGSDSTTPVNGEIKPKIALITGITGQDGSYLTEFLLDKGYEVHGLIRRSSNFNTQRINHIYIDPHNAHKARMKLHYADLSDASSLRRWLDTINPDEVYNLAAQSHVAVSFEIPDYTADVVATGALRLLEAVRSHIAATGRSQIKYYQAGSSEMFGSTPPPQSETTPFHPRSPYAASKCAAHWYTVNYREAYGLYACNGILFNHESPRRGENFVTRKITRAVGRIKVGLQNKLFLGNLQASRDWGFAGDYVEAMWMMLQQEKPDDYVVATEESHTVEEFLEVAFGYVGLNWKDHVVIDKRYFRPAEVDNLKGDSSKTRKVLGWKPKVGFEQLVKMMVEEDIDLAKREKVLVDAGFMDAQQQP
ncbi:GDP-MANNOSE 46 DEHYDRATASE 1-LIKE [Salix viminalis]|uniref:GDP-mannose 4,6-dehydratase n=1 Tax=Salix viminalis TaxID=40686 RepID=A0A9Q0NZD0_SALVM|nr:GDP-MANNOSE 46 DEHYDRATASE 1-LIKE [Salix viminalis]